MAVRPWALPTALRLLKAAGPVDRSVIGMAIEVIKSVKFLTEEQRRDIFYNNAARFLRVASSDGRVGPRLPGPRLEPTAPRS